MKIELIRKITVRAAATLVLLTFFGCISASTNDLEFIHNSEIDSSSRQSIANEEQSSTEIQKLFQTENNASPQSKIFSVSSRLNRDQVPSSAPAPAVSVSSAQKPGTGSSPASKSTTVSNPVSNIPVIATAVKSIAKPTASTKNYIVGYYTAWSRNSGFTPDKINVSKLTHINYAFADISSGLQVVMDEPNTDLRNLSDLKNLKKKNSALKIIISVGGWDNSQRFSDAAATGSSRETFAQSCLNFVLNNGLDGVDLDWEYPVSGGLTGNTHRPQDKQNYTMLAQAIRQKLNMQTARDGKQYFLTITGAPDKGFLNSIEPAALLSYTDYLFIMGYDMHGPWEDYADYNAPLYSSDKININQGIANYINAGVSAKKLVLGMPFYGYLYQVTKTSSNGFKSPFTSSKSISYDTVVSQYLNHSGYAAYYDSTAMVPYLFGGNTFISYENPNSIAKKAGLARKYGLAGVGAWELAFDKSSALLSSAYAALQ
jgi:chitinase